MTHTSQSSEETKKIAADFARELLGGEVILLEGNLGAGKTTFVQGMAEALGAQDAARSPTFSILNAYPTDHARIRELVHLDFYRMKRPEELIELGLEEWLGREDTVVVIEWPPKELETSHLRGYRIQLEAKNPSSRTIAIQTLP